MIERLDWDSEFFGFEIGNVVSGELDAERLEAEAREHGYRCLYYRCAADDARAPRAAAAAGFALADIRVTLHMTSIEALPPTSTDSESPSIGPAAPADLAQLESIAEELSAQSRFAFDPEFGPDAARRLYAEWLRVSHAGRAAVVLVARQARLARGFITCLLEEDLGRLELVAVSRSAAGRGIGTLLVAESCRWLAARGAARIVVATQGRNTAAINFYTRCGFRVADTELVFHRWFAS